MLGNEFKRVIKNAAERLEQKWKKPYSITKNHANFRMSLAIIRGASRCITGASTKINVILFRYSPKFSSQNLLNS